MAKPKKATDGAADKVGTGLRSASPDDAGGADGAAAGAQLAVEILHAELRRLKLLKVLDAETGKLVALYARTLSDIEQVRARRGGGDDLSKLKTEELLEMAMQDPQLRDAFRRLK